MPLGSRHSKHPLGSRLGWGKPWSRAGQTGSPSPSSGLLKFGSGSPGDHLKLLMTIHHPRPLKQKPGGEKRAQASSECLPGTFGLYGFQQFPAHFWVHRRVRGANSRCSGVQYQHSSGVCPQNCMCFSLAPGCRWGEGGAYRGRGPGKGPTLMNKSRLSGGIASGFV